MKRGIVMVVTIIVLMLILIAGSLALFLVSKSIYVTGAQQRGYTAFQAAEGGIERGMQLVDINFKEGNVNIPPENINISGYDVQVKPEFIGVFTQAGAAIEFAVGYLGYGIAASKGGSYHLYSIFSDAGRERGAQSNLETVQKKVIGFE